MGIMVVRECDPNARVHFVPKGPSAFLTTQTAALALAEFLEVLQRHVQKVALSLCTLVGGTVLRTERVSAGSRTRHGLNLLTPSQSIKILLRACKPGTCNGASPAVSGLGA